MNFDLWLIRFLVEKNYAEGRLLHDKNLPLIRAALLDCSLRLKGGHRNGIPGLMDFYKALWGRLYCLMDFYRALWRRFYSLVLKRCNSDEAHFGWENTFCSVWNFWDRTVPCLNWSNKRSSNSNTLLLLIQGTVTHCCKIKRWQWCHHVVFLLRKLHSWDMKMEKEEITQLGYEDGKRWGRRTKVVVKFGSWNAH